MECCLHGLLRLDHLLHHLLFDLVFCTLCHLHDLFNAFLVVSPHDFDLLAMLAAQLLNYSLQILLRLLRFLQFSIQFFHRCLMLVLHIFLFSLQVLDLSCQPKLLLLCQLFYLVNFLASLLELPQTILLYTLDLLLSSLLRVFYSLTGLPFSCFDILLGLYLGCFELLIGFLVRSFEGFVKLVLALLSRLAIGDASELDYFLELALKFSQSNVVLSNGDQCVSINFIHLIFVL